MTEGNLIFWSPKMPDQPTPDTNATQAPRRRVYEIAPEPHPEPTLATRNAPCVAAGYLATTVGRTRWHYGERQALIKYEGGKRPVWVAAHRVELFRRTPKSDQP
jgi:hypothetical protein